MDDHAATIAAWRERGAHRFDPVRFRFIEALARRAADHDGPVRRMLDDKLAGLLATYGDDLERSGRTDDKAPARPPHRGPLAELVEHIARHAPPPAEGRAELKALQQFRRTWSRISAHQRLRQSLAHVPKNAGPLNSQHLVHRSLTLMRDVSPEYLERFMAHVDALLCLERANASR